VNESPYSQPFGPLDILSGPLYYRPVHSRRSANQTRFYRDPVKRVTEPSPPGLQPKENREALSFVNM
jgi:hypothetical protein